MRTQLHDRGHIELDQRLSLLVAAAKVSELVAKAGVIRP